MKNSSYDERKQIIRPSKQDLGEMYQTAPLRQILSLKLPSLQQLILINFFSHNYDGWKLSISGISKSIGRAKNRKSIATALKKLKSLGYLIITEYTYEVNVKKINEVYQASIKKDELEPNYNRVGVVQNVSGDTTDNRVSDTKHSTPGTNDIRSDDMNSNTPVRNDTRVGIVQNVSGGTNDNRVGDMISNNPDTNDNRMGDMNDNRVPDTNDNTNKRNIIKEIDKGNIINETDKGNGKPILGVGVRININANTDKPSNLSSVVEIPTGTNLPAKQNAPDGILKPVDTSTIQPLGFDHFERDEIFKTLSPAKQHNPTDKPVNKKFNHNIFTHNGTKVEPVEVLQLIDDRFVFEVDRRYRGTEYLSFDAFQIMIGLYNQLLNQDIINYQKLKYDKFERIMLISILDDLEKAGKKIPDDRNELQSLAVLFSLDKFDAVYKHFTDDPDYFRSRITEIQDKYSNIYDRTPVLA